MQNNNARQMYMYKANSSDRPTYNIHFYVYSVQGNVQDKFISPLQNIKTRISKYIFRTKHYISNNYHKLCTSTWRSSHSSLLFYVDSPTCQMHSMDLFKNTKNKTGGQQLILFQLQQGKFWSSILATLLRNANKLPTCNVARELTLRITEKTQNKWSN